MILPRTRSFASSFGAISLLVATLSLSTRASAQPIDPTPTPDAPPPPSVPPAEPQPPTPIPPPLTPAPEPKPANPVTIAAPPEPSEDNDRPAEGRALVAQYNSGFQWGIAPGIAVVNDKVGFAASLRLGYGFDLGPVILVPGVRVAAYFVEGTVFVPMPTAKLVIPIGAFAPFIEGGVGAGYVSKPSAAWGVSLLGGAGFMYHFSDRFALGIHGSYETILGKPSFDAIGVGPIIAIGF